MLLLRQHCDHVGRTVVGQMQLSDLESKIPYVVHAKLSPNSSDITQSQSTIITAFIITTHTSPQALAKLSPNWNTRPWHLYSNHVPA